jgi:hypothetical protein
MGKWFFYYDCRFWIGDCSPCRCCHYDDEFGKQKVKKNASVIEAFFYKILVLDKFFDCATFFTFNFYKINTNF